MITPQQTSFNVLLIGDTCKDIYQFGTIDRLSPEAPVPVFVPTRLIEREGMAGNVYKNLSTFGCRVNLISGGLSKKTRLIDERSRQQIVRIDEDVTSEPVVFETMIPPIYDAIVISDYDKGVVSYEMVEELRKEFGGPIFIDTKKTDLRRFDGCFVKINELESTKITSNTFSKNLIVTLGGSGAMCDGKFYDAPKVEVVDVTGAGDTFLAALTFGYLQYNQIDEAIKFAIKAASVTVQHLGVYAPTLEEIE